MDLLLWLGIVVGMWVKIRFDNGLLRRCNRLCKFFVKYKGCYLYRSGFMECFG